MITDDTDNSDLACPQQVEIPGYIRKELSGQEKTAFEAHLEGCKICRDSVTGLGIVIEHLEKNPNTICKSNISERVMAGISEAEWNEKKQSVNESYTFQGWFKIAALFILTAGICYIAMLNPKTDNPPEAVPKINAPDPITTSTQPQGLNKHITTEQPQVAMTRKALDWLQKSQQPNGSWSSEQTGGKDCFIGVTSLALLAFLDQGDDVLQGPYAQTVQNGIDYLVSKQSEIGLIGPKVSVAPYNHGLAALAILKACKAEGENRWQVPAEKAIKFICSSQLSSGGWGYLLSASPDNPANTSASIWPLQALIYADAIGIQGLRLNIENGLSWLRSTIDQDGFMGYTKARDLPSGQDTMTVAGFVCFLKDSKWKNHPSARTLIPAFRKIAASRDDKTNYYRTFFINEAMKLAKDEQLASNQPAQLAKFASTQNSSGSNAGSWDNDDPWGTVGGRVYSTSMAALTISSISGP